MTLDELQSKPVIVRYFEQMDPVSEDMAGRLPGETYEVRNIELALEFHPRGEIIGFVGQPMTLSTSRAKSLLTRARKAEEEPEKQEEEKEEEPERTEQEDPERTEQEDPEKVARQTPMTLLETESPSAESLVRTRQGKP